MLCAWGAEDQQMLINDCKLHRIDYDWTSEYIDIKNQYRDLNKLNKQIGLKKCLRLEGFEFDGVAHRALDDTENTAKIFLRYLDEWMF